MHTISLQQFYNTYMGRTPRTINVTMENKMHSDVISITIIYILSSNPMYIMYILERDDKSDCLPSGTKCPIIL